MKNGIHSQFPLMENADFYTRAHHKLSKSKPTEKKTQKKRAWAKGEQIKFPANETTC